MILNIIFLIGVFLVTFEAYTITVFIIADNSTLNNYDAITFALGIVMITAKFIF